MMINKEGISMALQGSDNPAKFREQWDKDTEQKPASA